MRRSIIVFPLVSVVVSCALVSCLTPTAPLPAGSVRFVPPPAYRMWWAMMLACSGLNGDVNAIDWYVLPGATALPRADHAQGEWQAAANRIVIAGSEQFDGSLVRHEMLHALLGNTPGHPRQWFMEACGGVVVCDDVCLADAGPPGPPPTDAERVDTGGVSVAGSVISEDSLMARDGRFALVVTARNTSASSVVVRLPSQFPDTPGLTFGLVVNVPGGSESWQSYVGDSGITRFAPGETKRQVYDFVVGPSLAADDLPPGRYSFVGSFGGKDALPVSFSAPP